MNETIASELRSRLDQLAHEIVQGSAIAASKNWGGADVVIVPRAQVRSSDGFYPTPRYVVTRNSRHLSWLFEKLRDCFYEYKLVDGCSKIEFFGRLANAAIRYQSQREGAEVRRDLLLAVLHEAFVMLGEMEKGDFSFLGVAIGNEIADDHVQREPGRGFVSIEETKRFFVERGVTLE